MAEQRLHSALAPLDLLTREELDAVMSKHADRFMRQRVRGDTFMRLPLVYGTAANGALNIVSNVGPDGGYMWDISMLGISGLTAGATPDVVNMSFVGSATLPWWQFNGNNFAYTFSRGQMVMFSGETITLQSVGTFNATGQIILFGAIRAQVPSEKIETVIT